MNVSVAVVTQDGTQTATRALRGAITTGCLDGILINNGCCSEHLYTIRSELRQPVFRFIDLDPARGLPHCWNLALLYAEHPWVVIANDDVIFEDGWLEALEAQANAGYRCVTLAYPKNRWGCFALHKSLVAEMGFFDEAFAGIYFEDEDWWLRLQEHGEEPALIDAVRHDDGLRRKDRTTHGTKLALSREANESAFKAKWQVSDKGYKTKGKVDGRQCLMMRTRPEVDWHPYVQVWG